MLEMKAASRNERYTPSTWQECLYIYIDIDLKFVFVVFISVEPSTLDPVFGMYDLLSRLTVEQSLSSLARNATHSPHPRLTQRPPTLIPKPSH